MKLRILILALIFPLIGFSQGKNLQAFLSYCDFYNAETGPYLETYLAINGNSVNYYKKNNGKFQAVVQVTFIFKQEDKVINFKKYNLASQELDDTTNITVDFIDQQRFVLPEGKYMLEMLIADSLSKKKPFEVLELIEMTSPKEEIFISGIQLAQSFEKSQNNSVLSKSGYDIIPFVYGFYPESMNKLQMYCEIYNTNKLLGEDGLYFQKVFIESYETGQMMGNLIIPSREKATEVKVILNEFDISKLPSGNYNLVVEVRDVKNVLIKRNAIFFQRSNPNISISLDDIKAIDTEFIFSRIYTSIDTLAEMIRSLYPISTELEKVFALNQLQNNDITLMQQYFYHFWYNRNPIDPYQEWLAYSYEVMVVNNEFSTSIKKGYETDRGAIYLRYGKPNTIYSEPHEPMAYPYEIWHYYHLPPNQRNKKFVFVSTDLVTADYDLIHSNALGEMNDPQWELRIHKRDSGTGTNVDQEDYDTHYGGRAREIFNNPF